jgi:hypothetical protein
MARRKMDEDPILEAFDQAQDNTAMILGAIVAVGLGIFLVTRRAAAQAATGMMGQLRVSVTLGGQGKPQLVDQMALATALRTKLAAACPGAPKLLKTVQRTPVELEDGTFRIVYTFDAMFSGPFNPDTPFLRDAVADCVLNFIKNNATFGGRVIGIRAKRIS